MLGENVVRVEVICDVPVVVVVVVVHVDAVCVAVVEIVTKFEAESVSSSEKWRVIFFSRKRTFHHLSVIRFERYRTIQTNL